VVVEAQMMEEEGVVVVSLVMVGVLVVRGL